MHLANLTDTELRNARRAGFKRKKPKKGKLPTMRSAEGYADRWNGFVKDAKEKVREHKRKEDEKKKLKSFKEQIRRNG